MNFCDITVTVNKRTGVTEIWPDFKFVRRDPDLMIRGKNFYAIWDEEAGVWSQNEMDAITLVDKEILEKEAQLKNSGVTSLEAKVMERYSTGSQIEFKGYISRHPDQFHPLDDKLTFADDVVKKKDYVSKRLPYNLAQADHKAYDEIMEVLYSPEERKKIEWAIGSIVSGDSKKIQKFYVLYGKGGTGKGTVLKIIKKLFPGYTATFCAKDLTMSSKEFSMETFASNPLVAIDQDGDLSKIEDATRVNSIVSHEDILINAKGQPHFPYTPHCTLFIGSNEPVKIKDEESGLIRRLIDIEPTGKKIPSARYHMLMNQIDFELGGIAHHCLQVYNELGISYYDKYRPQSMLYRTNAFTNFILDRADDFMDQDGVSLKTAYKWWEQYCVEAGVPNRLQRHKFGDELKNYFYNFEERARINGIQVRSWYSGFHFIEDENSDKKEDKATKPDTWLNMTCTSSLLDDILKDCVAQYVDPENPNKPAMSWSDVKTHLRDLDTKQLHYILPPEWLFMIDFDLKDENGNKNRELNLAAASKWPATYAEFSKSGAGIHLYYRYTGDLQDLLSEYAKEVEVKVYNGKAAIRRMVTLCNDIPIATISSGLPKKAKKEVKKNTVDISVVEYEKYLINVIRKAMKSARDPDYEDRISSCTHTKPACDFIKHILDEAYESKKHYDVSNMRKNVDAFAIGSTNNKRYCTDLVRKMKWHSEDVSTQVEPEHHGIIVFYDIEVFPNVNMVNWKIDGPDHPVVRMINPKPEEIEELLKYDLIGFNCRKYDNHILHAMRLGYSPAKVYEVSKAIISGNPDGYFREAWDYSLTDIYDFSSEKKSLKKFEIDLGIHHKELGMDWTKPVPEERWAEVAEYCDNDVLATEALFHSPKRQADWVARQILADIAGMSVNSTTNSLTTRIIFGEDKKPQSEFNYRNMGDVSALEFTGNDINKDLGVDDTYTMFDEKRRPIFPGYEYKKVTVDSKGVKLDKPYWVSLYRGEEVGEGGYVYSEPGIYNNVALLDIASMHPSSIVAEDLFGPKYTKVFNDILQARIFIKHGQYDEAKKLFGGKLAKYLDDPKQADALSGALKIAINSVYGLTSAKFDNLFRDIRNADNIVAKRGALFMVNLKHEVQNRGYTVAHIKTDSIKIPNADNHIIKFVMDYGRMYGYNFEHELTYERMCLITKADYVAKCATEEQAMALYGYLPTKQKKYSGQWTETGDWFKDSYLFKTLFTHEPITLEDMYEVNSVTTALYLDMNENLSKDEHQYTFVGKCGAFCPVLPGSNGGELLREDKGKYSSANGAKGYRWKEYEVVKELGLENQVDRSYYDKRTAKAKAEIDKLGSYDLFVSDLPYPNPTK